MNPSVVEPPAAARPARPELAVLMSLRIFFAVGVFVLHLSVLTGGTLYPGATVDQWPTWLQVMHEGYYRQTFFLMLSGFILMYVYGDAVRRRPPGWTSGFLVKRVARIWPLHILMLLVMVPGAIDTLMVRPVRVLAAFAANATLLHGWFSLVPVTGDTNVANAFNGPSWALSAELVCYLAFPVVGGLAARRLTVRTALVAMLVVWAVVLGIDVASESLPTTAASLELVYLFPPVRLLDFVVGVLLGVVFLSWSRGQQARAQVEPQADATATHWGAGGDCWRWTAAEIAVVLWLVVDIVVRNHLAVQVRYVAWYMPVMAAMLFVFACARGRLSKALSWRPLVALGRLSFAFYLIHFPVLVYAQRVAGFRGVEPAGIAAVFALTLVLAWLSNHHFEPWARRRITNAWARLETRRMAASDATHAAHDAPARLDDVA